MNPEFQQEILDWCAKTGWIIDNDEYINVMCKYKLENLPYKPHFLIKRDNEKFLITIFEKDEFFYAKSKQTDVTGFDYFKYDFLLYFQRETNIPVAIIMKELQTGHIIFKELDFLLSPIIWRRDANVCVEHKLHYVQCWKDHAWRIGRSKQKKIRPMAIWPVEKFTNEFIYNARLFN